MVEIHHGRVVDVPDYVPDDERYPIPAHDIVGVGGGWIVPPTLYLDWQLPLDVLAEVDESLRNPDVDEGPVIPLPEGVTIPDTAGFTGGEFESRFFPTGTRPECAWCAGHQHADEGILDIHCGDVLLSSTRVVLDPRTGEPYPRR